MSDFQEDLTCAYCNARLRSHGAHCRCCGNATRCDLCDAPLDPTESFIAPSYDDRVSLTVCSDCAGR